MWFIENPWPPIFVLVAVAVALILLWSQAQRTKYLYALVGVLAACVVVFFVEQQIVTPAEEVEMTIADLRTHCVNGNAEAAAAIVSAEQPALQVIVKQGLSMIDLKEDLSIKDVRITMQSDDTRAVSHFRANGTFSDKVSGYEQHAPTRWRVHWTRKGTDWKIIKIERLSPTSGEEMGTLQRSVE